MTKAKNGDKAKVHYTGRLEDGTVFDSSNGREPLEFTLGEGQLIQGFEQGVLGMQVGESKTVTISPEEGYGHPKEELKVTVSKTDFPADIEPEIGQRLQLQNMQGQPIPVIISAVEGETVTLDANHPLAGKTLHFDLELMELTA
ncbi:FKBP-type peptidyl-prolyl cis-trans isomerase [Desulfatiglans anilini]|uniref:FKBP-type peptidyl-prolyl cis-trans isomerase n=1 Tax=Desulfatiglans anilini TaxID=90728 RepID=UPI00040DAD98|nr:peptidylprolyl isomerase [Desulfatiglans anilini]